MGQSLLLSLSITSLMLPTCLDCRPKRLTTSHSLTKERALARGNKAEPKENSALPGAQSPRRLKRSLGGETVSKSRLRNKVFKRKQIDGSRLKRLASCFLVVTMKSASKFPQ